MMNPEPNRKMVVQTSQAPAAVGPYVQARWAGDLLFLSGQIGLDPATGKLVAGDTAAQARQCLNNLAAVLEAAGLTPCNVVKTTVYLADIADFQSMNEVYAQAFAPCPHQPARAAFQVAALPLGARVEIEAVAAV